MWRFTNLHIKNLGTHKDSQFSFLKGKTILLLGKNKTQTSANSNGSGKSFVVNGIEIALVGETGRDVGKEDFIRYGEEFCEIILSLENDILKRTMTIERKIFSKKTQEITITVNGKEIFNTSVDKNTSQADKYILDQLGINKEDLFNYFIIPQGNDSTFFTANDTKQKEIIGRFSNFTAIDSLIKKYSKEYDDYEEEKRDVESDIISCNTSISQYQDDIKELYENFQQDKENDILTAKEEIVELEEELHTNEELLKQVKIKGRDQKINLVKVCKLAEKMDIVKYENDNIELRKNKRRIEEELQETIKLTSELNRQKGGVVKCPGCSLEFIPGNKEISVKKLNASIKECDELKDHLETELEEIAGKISKNHESISKKINLNNQIEAIESQIERDSRTIEKYVLLINNMKTSIEVKEENLKKLISKKKPDDSIILNKIEKQKEKLEELEENKNTLIKKMEDCSFYKFHFSNKGFRTFLANKSIKSIQDIVNFYLKKFDIGLQTMISGVTTLKNGEVRDKISIQILDNGRVKNFKAFSGGERERIKMSSIVALNSLINSTVEYGKGLDALIVDECEFLDLAGTQKIVDLFEKSKITSFLILQFLEGVSFENIAYVEKVKGVSKVFQ